ncbi:SRPBCC family protein [Paenarthrobacter sp. PAE-2]|uniref:SRPBCC family protein n=1 Tax=Paenarthrobacter sp. PAE-2 TaxID=2982532 RepID=UPI002230FBD9|nr:SRPBCC family protein [Paenarthrobacter sp. PAE-2]MCW3767951.1 SRPBCC family protein [Paenarthrobacter sp. PAE-2]
MSPWFKKTPATSPLAEAPVYHVSASTSIKASPQMVWDLIKPAEKAPLLSPETVCGFRAPDVEGLGEIQVFISVVAGVEHVTAVEVMEEIPGEMAITRTIGDEDPAARMRFTMHSADDGTSVLEIGKYFTLPPDESENLAKYERNYGLLSQQYVDRVKTLLE